MQAFSQNTPALSSAHDEPYFQQIHQRKSSIGSGRTRPGEGAGGPCCASSPAAAEPRRAAGPPQKSILPNVLQRGRARPHGRVLPRIGGREALGVPCCQGSLCSLRNEVCSSAAGFAAAASSWAPFLNRILFLSFYSVHVVTSQFAWKAPKFT